MTITINGQPRELSKELPLTALLKELGMNEKPVVVELNGTAILQADYPATQVQDRAKIEIITLAAGG